MSTIKTCINLTGSVPKNAFFRVNVIIQLRQYQICQTKFMKKSPIAVKDSTSAKEDLINRKELLNNPNLEWDKQCPRLRK